MFRIKDGFNFGKEKYLRKNTFSGTFIQSHRLLDDWSNMSKETQHKIIEKGMDLIYDKGYHGVGLQKILDEAKVPKGSFYHYFKSKEDFGLKLIDFYSNETIDFLKTFLNNKDQDPKKRIFDLFEVVMDTYRSQNFSKGCLLGNCSLELGNEEAFGKNIARHFKEWQDLFEQTIAEGQEAGVIKKEYQPSEYAAFLLNSWEGALVRMKSEKSIEPMNLFIQFMKKLL